MNISPQSIQNFKTYAEVLQGVTDDTKDKILGIISILEVMHLESVEKTQRAFQGLRNLIVQDMRPIIPVLYSFLDRIEREAIDKITQVGSKTLPIAIPFSVAVVAASHTAPSAQMEQNEGHHGVKRCAIGPAEGEKETKRPSQNMLSRFSKIASIPTIKDYFFSIDDIIYAVWTTKDTVANPDETIISIQERGSYERGVHSQKIAICIKKTETDTVILSISIDAIRLKDTEIPDRWIEQVHKALSLIVEFCL